VGDLALDIVLAPARPLEYGTDVPGRVAIHQGGSAANTARWLARLGVETQLVSAVGRDAAGRALVDALRADGVTPRVVRNGKLRTARIGVLVDPGGERSFVADRGAADALAADDLRAAWFRGVDVVHLPAYSLLGRPLGLAGREAIRLGRSAGALVSLDLASVGPLLADGRDAALALVRDVAPDLLFATAAELYGLLGTTSRTDARATDLAAIVVIKRGAAGVTVLVREMAGGVAGRAAPGGSSSGGSALGAAPGGSSLKFDVTTHPVAAADTTGAGDAFDAGFIAEWLASRGAGRTALVALRRSAVVGNRIAARQVAAPRRELQLGRPATLRPWRSPTV
jgi:sugar/nucleoside kinase (ribokinase family)